MKIKFRSRTTIFIHDLIMVPIAWLGSYWLRFDFGSIPKSFLTTAVDSLLFVILIQVGVFWFFGLYKGVWRFSSIPDLLRIAKSVLVGLFIIIIFLFLYNRLEGVPRAILPLYACLLFLFLCIPRSLYRYWKDNVLQEKTGKRALIIGAGEAGEMLARDLLKKNDSGYLPIAYVDDDKNKRKQEIRGIPVVGSIRKTPRFIGQFQIEVLLIAIPSAKDSEMRRIVEICEQSSIPFQTLPSLKELLSGKVNQDTLRDVSIVDILGREPVSLNWSGIEKSLNNKKILVTGGGGSIGAELCQQLAKINPEKLVVLDRSEFNLYQIDNVLKKTFPELEHEAILGDVTDRFSVRKVIRLLKPDVIFHTAAYKHVPLLENQARAAVNNNLLGTKTLAEEAIAAKVERFVLISTDKAVNPTNVMGATKRAAEILCQNLDKTDSTRFSTVRFGNVLDSAGSVVPLFRDQIKTGGPVTVTHPEITRFFMTISEACQLIMQAEAAGTGGEIFVLDMGEPIKIAYLAEQMIRLSGKQPGKDIKVEFIGLRPGEKLYEELFHDQEEIVETNYEKLFLANARRHDKPTCKGCIEKLMMACEQNDDAKILNLLKDLVSEFKAKIEHKLP